MVRCAIKAKQENKNLHFAYSEQRLIELSYEVKKVIQSSVQKDTQTKREEKIDIAPENPYSLIINLLTNDFSEY